MRISDWSSDVCSSDLTAEALWPGAPPLDVPPRNALIPEPPRIDLNATPILPERPAPSLAPPPDADAVARSEERRVGKEGASTCRAWWAPHHAHTTNVHQSLSRAANTPKQTTQT